MTPEQINKAIAESVGWKPTRKKIRNYPTWEHPDGRRCTAAQLPHYRSDLNAIHEVVVQLRSKAEVGRELQWATYNKLLCKLCTYSRWDTAHATAAQRCEAYLRTIGKWEEE